MLSWQPLSADEAAPFGSSANASIAGDTSMSLPRLRAYALLAALPFALVACGDDVDTAPPLNDGPVKRAFEDASIAEGVPESLLLAIGWVETHWSHVQPSNDIVEGEEDDAHGMGLFGIMQLGARGDTNTLLLAAELLDKPVEVVREDLASNVRGAAAVLRRYADEMYEGLDVEGLDLFAWRDVVALWTGIDDPHMAYSVVEEVYAVMRDGVGLELESGENLELFPNPGLGSPDESAFGQTDGPLKGLAGVKFLQAHSDHYGKGGNKPTHIIIHTMQGSYLGSQNWARISAAERKRQGGSASNSSAHYYVRSKDGDITQMVSEDDRAYHAVNWNSKSVGIEHEGFVDNPSWYTDAMYKESARITCDAAARWSIPLDLDHIISHQQVDPKRRTDPGKHWDWAYYMSLLRACSGGGPQPGTSPDPKPPVNPAEGTLQGLVYEGGNTNNRIPGASIRLSNGKTVTADASGYWSINVAPGTYTVTASKDGYQPTSVSRTVASKTQVWASTNLTKSAVVTPTGTLGGVVYDSADSTKRIASATLKVGDKSIVTDSNGRFSVQVNAGAQSVQVSATDFVSQTLSTTVNKGQTTTLNIGLVSSRQNNANGTIVGVIYEAPTTTKRIPGAVVKFTSGTKSLSTTADGDGYYEIKAPPGTWRVTATAPNFAAGSTSVSLAANQKPWGSIGLRKIEKGAGDGTLTGIVYESPTTTRRLKGATVTLSTGQSVTTDANGVYTVPVSGEVSAVANYPGFSPRAVSRTVGAGQTVWGSIGLVKGGTPSGDDSPDKCVPTGIPVPHTPPYTIELLAPARGDHTSLTPTFEFSGVGDSTASYRIVLIKTDHAQQPAVEFEAGRANAANKVTFKLPKPLTLTPNAPNIWIWSAYAYWPDCAKTETLAWTNFFPTK